MHSFSVLAAAAAPSSPSLGRSRFTFPCAAPLPVDPDSLRCFPGYSHPGFMRSAASPSSLSPPASRPLSFFPSPIRSLLLFLFPSPCLSAAVSFSLFVAPDIPFPGRIVPGRSSPDALRPPMFRSAAPGAPLDDPVRGFGPCSCPPRMLQSGASFCRFHSVASDVPVCGPGFPPGRSSPVLVPCSTPRRMLQSGASFCRFLSVASDAPVRGTGFSPGRSSSAAWAVLLSAPDAPIRGVLLSYSLCCLRRSSPWHWVHPRTIRSGG